MVKCSRLTGLASVTGDKKDIYFCLAMFLHLSSIDRILYWGSKALNAQHPTVCVLSGPQLKSDEEQVWTETQKSDTRA